MAAEQFLGSELCEAIVQRAQEEVDEAIKDILNTPLDLLPDEYKSRVTALVTEVHRRENALHWINDVLIQFHSHEESLSQAEDA